MILWSSSRGTIIVAISRSRIGENGEEESEKVGLDFPSTAINLEDGITVLPPVSVALGSRTRQVKAGGGIAFRDGKKPAL